MKITVDLPDDVLEAAIRKDMHDAIEFLLRDVVMLRGLESPTPYQQKDLEDNLKLLAAFELVARYYEPADV